jgi:hypothetical protein
MLDRALLIRMFRKTNNQFANDDFECLHDAIRRRQDENATKEKGWICKEHFTLTGGKANKTKLTNLENSVLKTHDFLMTSLLSYCVIWYEEAAGIISHTWGAAERSTRRVLEEFRSLVQKNPTIKAKKQQVSNHQHTVFVANIAPSNHTPARTRAEK